MEYRFIPLEVIICSIVTSPKLLRIERKRYNDEIIKLLKHAGAIASDFKKFYERTHGHKIREAYVLIDEDTYRFMPEEYKKLCKPAGDKYKYYIFDYRELIEPEYKPTIGLVEISEPISVSWAIYDPAQRDLSEPIECIDPIIRWINSSKDRYNFYWLAICIKNNIDKDITNFKIEFECSPSTLMAIEAYVEGFENKIEPIVQAGSGIDAVKYMIPVSRAYGVSIPSGGSKRVFIKLHSDVWSKEYKIENATIHLESFKIGLRALKFYYSCDVVDIKDEEKG